MIKIIIPIFSLDSILMIKNSGSGTPNDDQKHVDTLVLNICYADKQSFAKIVQSRDE